MDNRQFMRFSQLLVTTICHDLAGPLGGISNGVEFLQETSENPVGLSQSLDLLALSSREASFKLQFFRIAYGIIYDESQMVDITEIQSLVDKFFMEKRITLGWHIPGAITHIDHPSRQLLVNMILLMGKLLQEQGTIDVLLYPSEGKSRMEVRGRMPVMKVNEKLLAMLKNENAMRDVAIDTVHPVFIRLLAHTHNRNLQVGIQPGVLTLHA
ncbi:MAG: hypothetical protein GC136_11580 [Alphaproteobacteria bacterium]|nr:hypothetical protein [Alphaproteobacteria bacterium]